MKRKKDNNTKVMSLFKFSLVFLASTITATTINEITEEEPVGSIIANLNDFGFDKETIHKITHVVVKRNGKKLKYMGIKDMINWFEVDKDVVKRCI